MSSVPLILPAYGVAGRPPSARRSPESQVHSSAQTQAPSGAHPSTPNPGYKPLSDLHKTSGCGGSPPVHAPTPPKNSDVQKECAPRRNSPQRPPTSPNHSPPPS